MVYLTHASEFEALVVQASEYVLTKQLFLPTLVAASRSALRSAAAPPIQDGEMDSATARSHGPGRPAPDPIAWPTASSKQQGPAHGSARLTFRGLITPGLLKSQRGHCSGPLLRAPGTLLSSFFLSHGFQLRFGLAQMLSFF